MAHAPDTGVRSLHRRATRASHTARAALNFSTIAGTVSRASSQVPDVRRLAAPFACSQAAEVSPVFAHSSFSSVAQGPVLVTPAEPEAAGTGAESALSLALACAM